MVCTMVIALVAFVRVGLGFLTAALVSIGCLVCTILPTKRMDFPARFFMAWSLPTLLEHLLRIQAPSEIASKLTLHIASLGLGGGAVFAAYAQVRPQYGCVFPFSTNFGRARHC